MPLHITHKDVELYAAISLKAKRILEESHDASGYKKCLESLEEAPFASNKEFFNNLVIYKSRASQISEQENQPLNNPDDLNRTKTLLIKNILDFIDKWSPKSEFATKIEQTLRFRSKWDETNNNIFYIHFYSEEQEIDKMFEKLLTASLWEKIIKSEYKILNNDGSLGNVVPKDKLNEIEEDDSVEIQTDTYQSPTEVIFEEEIKKNEYKDEQEQGEAMEYELAIFNAQILLEYSPEKQQIKVSAKGAMEVQVKLLKKLTGWFEKQRKITGLGFSVSSYDSTLIDMIYDEKHNLKIVFQLSPTL